MSDSAAVTSPVTAPRPPRPPIIDLADGPCEQCQAWQAANLGKKPGERVCNRCATPIPVYENMWGNGFQSPLHHHYHLRPVGAAGVPGREVLWQELCLACYQADHTAAYPTLPLPQPPRQLVEAVKIPTPEPSVVATGEDAP